MATATLKRKPTPHSVIPPLENGDHLTAAEFERRFDAMPSLKKAELIKGVVFVASPVRHREHGRPHTHLLTWLGTYEARTPGVQSGAESSLRLDNVNELMPDALLFVESACGGQVRLNENGYVVGGPEFLGEVSASSTSMDLKSKFDVYCAHRVQEYLVWRVLDEEVDWFVRRGSRFRRHKADQDGIHRSRVFPGLWLDAAALVAGDLARVLDVLHAGLASPAHAAFVEELRSRRA